MFNTQTINGEMWLAGTGPVPCDTMILLQNPTRMEAQSNRPFTSPSSLHLAALLADMGKPSTDMRVTYAVKYATYQDKEPKASDLKACAEVLAAEIEECKPKTILAFGSTAMRAALGPGYKISDFKGLRVASPRYPGVEVVPLWAPGFIARQPQFADQFHRDLAVALFGQTSEEVPYTVARSPDEFRTMLLAACEGFDFDNDIVWVDCEWHGQDPRWPDTWLRTLQLNMGKGVNIVAELGRPELTPSENRAMGDAMLAVFREFLTFKGPKLGGHNLRSSDGDWLRDYESPIDHLVVYDSMLAEHLINNERAFDLTSMTLHYAPELGNYEEPLIRWKKSVKKEVFEDGYGQVPEEILYPYGARDVETLRRVHAGQKAELARYLQPRGEYCSLFESVMRADLDIVHIRGSGMLIDMELLKSMTGIYSRKRAELAKEMTTAVMARGFPDDFNCGSTNQVRNLLFGPKTIDFSGREQGGLGLTPIQTTGKQKKRWEWVLRQPEHIQKNYAPSTDKNTLEILSLQHPLARLLTDLRKVDIVCKNFLREPGDGEDYDDIEGGIAGNIYPDGRLHPRFTQLLDTGRYATRKPNTQNFSKQSERHIARIFGKDAKVPNLRSLIIPRPGHCLMEFDYKQAELFVLAYLSGDDTMISLLTTPGMDLHDTTTIRSFTLKVMWPNGQEVDENELLMVARDDFSFFEELQNSLLYVKQNGDVLSRKELKASLRIAGKSVSFGVPYGRGAQAIATQIFAETGNEIAVEDVQKSIVGWKTTYNKAWTYLEACQNKAVDPGYIESPLGRRRYFPRVHDQEMIAAFKRECGNFTIQNVVADTIRLACARLLDNRGGLKFNVVNQIHDALLLEVPFEEIDETRILGVEAMSAIGIPLPSGGKLNLGVDVEVYERWGEKLKKAK